MDEHQLTKGEDSLEVPSTNVVTNSLEPDLKSRLMQVGCFADENDGEFATPQIAGGAEECAQPEEGFAEVLSGPRGSPRSLNTECQQTPVQPLPATEDSAKPEWADDRLSSFTMQSAGDDDTKSSLIMIGNPGTGKSALLNAYIGASPVMFKSAASSGGWGVTSVLDKREHSGRCFMDTPGLSDLRLRKQAAEAINEAFGAGGSFSIVFVITHEDGRIRPDDITTMQLVFEAVNTEKEQVANHEYAIVVNKNKRKWMDKVLDKPVWISHMHEHMDQKNIPATCHVHFAPFDDYLDCEEDVLGTMDKETREFFDTLPPIQIVGEQVARINHEAWDEQRKNLESLIAKHEQDRVDLERLHLRRLSEAEDKLKKTAEEVEAKITVEMEAKLKDQLEARQEQEAKELQAMEAKIRKEMEAKVKEGKDNAEAEAAKRHKEMEDKFKKVEEDLKKQDEKNRVDNERKVEGMRLVHEKMQVKVEQMTMEANQALETQLTDRMAKMEEDRIAMKVKAEQDRIAAEAKAREDLQKEFAESAKIREQHYIFLSEEAEAKRNREKERVQQRNEADNKTLAENIQKDMKGRTTTEIKVAELCAIHAEAYEPGKFVLDGDLVFLEVLSTDSAHTWWLCDNPGGTYCATAGCEKTRAPFLLRFSRQHTAFTLEYQGSATYLQGCIFLYAAHTCSAKYELRGDSGRQMWAKNNEGNVCIRYGAKVQLMDQGSHSYLAVNWNSSASGYDNGTGKLWVEVKRSHNLLPGQFGHHFMFHRAK